MHLSSTKVSEDDEELRREDLGDLRFILGSFDGVLSSRFDPFERGEP